jgi:lipid II:glycine glycyltransferase (peptidoglycan interpeptide bridge formation enzyme)
VFCRIDSWLTGRRLVSLPFSDHCEPLVDSPEVLQELLNSLEHESEKENFRYIQIRPLNPIAERQSNFGQGERFWFHKIDLRPTLKELFDNFHKDCVQRKLRRAERENLSYEEGCSEILLKKFYDLLLRTRRRQQLPPQPLKWFRSVLRNLANGAKIRVASKDGRPVASILTLSYKNVLVYKYGCSDASQHQVGGIQHLFWCTIRKAKEDGILEFDLGRSEYNNQGLVTFKDRWGSMRSTLTYWSCPPQRPYGVDSKWTTRVAKQILSRAPNTLLTVAGNLLYRHVG